METFDLNTYFRKSINALVTDILANTLNDPAETAFMLRYRKASRQAAKKRAAWEAQGQHIPAFLICSITRSCNLFCKGCYAWSTGLCGEENKSEMLSDSEWDDIFRQSEELGVSFILLAGGEPLLRRDVLLKASTRAGVIFPVFTNGLLIDAHAAAFYSQHRNIIPVLSMEGARESTDARRGAGVYDQVTEKMAQLQSRNVLFGASVTVGKHNLSEVTADAFLEKLDSRGCRVVIYVEYVPVDPTSRDLAFEEPERAELARRLRELHAHWPGIAFLSFPGDEKYLGGCLAGGRGFFHINPDGNAEACPFAPYSDRNLREHTLQEALNSPFFRALKEAHLVGGEHTGGCALFEQDEMVRSLLAQTGRGAESDRPL